MSNFNFALASSLSSSIEQFPVNFDLAWEWLGYTRKDNAKAALLNAGFIRDTDLLITKESDNHRTSSLSPQEMAVQARLETITLTVDCFKMWAMMAGTDQGKQVRLYFLECEKIAKAQVVQSGIKTALPVRDATELSLTAERIETINNLTLRQLLRDELIDELSIKRGIKQLAPVKNEYTIVKVRAKELGYSLIDIGNGSALGKFVAKLVPIAFDERVGKYSVKHYLVNDQLDTAIKSYFGMKHALRN